MDLGRSCLAVKRVKKNRVFICQCVSRATQKTSYYCFGAFLVLNYDWRLSLVTSSF